MQPERNYEQPPQITPPPVATGSQVYMHPAAPPVQKPRTSILWVILVIIAIPMALDSIFGALNQARGSHLSYDGQRLPPAEARAAVQDIAAITQGEKAGDPSSLNTDYQPQTKIGEQFQTLMQTAVVASSKYLKDTAEARSKTFLTPHQLGTPNGRANARRIHLKYIAATNTYRIASTEYASKLAAFINQISGQQSIQPGAYQAEDNELARLSDGQSQGITKVLDFVDQERPSYDAQTHKLTFTSAAAVTEYKALADDVAVQSGVLAGRKGEILQRRQSALRQSLTTLQGYAM